VFVRGLSRNFTIPGRSPSVSGPKQTETGHDRSRLGFWGAETAGIRRTVRRVPAVSVPKLFRYRNCFGPGAVPAPGTVSVPKLFRPQTGTGPDLGHRLGLVLIWAADWDRS
jgi:hypothetical protein